MVSNNKRRKIILIASVISAVVSSLYIISSVLGLNIFSSISINISIIGNSALPFSFMINKPLVIVLFATVVATIVVIIIFKFSPSSNTEKPTKPPKDLTKNNNELYSRVLSEIEMLNTRIDNLTEKVDKLYSLVESYIAQRPANEKSIEEKNKEGINSSSQDKDTEKLYKVMKSYKLEKEEHLSEDEKLLQDLKDMVNKLIKINELLTGYTVEKSNI